MSPVTVRRSDSSPAESGVGSVVVVVLVGAADDPPDVRVVDLAAVLRFGSPPESCAATATLMPTTVSATMTASASRLMPTPGYVRVRPAPAARTGPPRRGGDSPRG